MKRGYATYRGLFLISIFGLQGLFIEAEVTPLQGTAALSVTLQQKRAAKKLPTNDQEAYSYCKRNKQSFISVVWPIAQGKDAEIKDIFNKYGKIIYKKKVFFTYTKAYTILKLAHPFITHMREHVDWYFPAGSYEKPARIFVLEFENTETAMACKYAVRHIFNLQYRPLHINDTHAETMELAEFFFR